MKHSDKIISLKLLGPQNNRIISWFIVNQLLLTIEQKAKKYNTVGKFPKSNRKLIERGTINTHNTNT
jgi:hypothetical protein